jgi:hypothetical protein
MTIEVGYRLTFEVSCNANDPNPLLRDRNDPAAGLAAMTPRSWKCKVYEGVAVGVKAGMGIARNSQAHRDSTNQRSASPRILAFGLESLPVE